MNLILIGGMPGTGKSTLAALVAAQYALPVLGKDPIKESLMDTLRGSQAPSSRQLSDAAFAVLFRLAGQLAPAGAGLILEGNFRPVEHAAAVASLTHGRTDAQLIQILCRLDEPARLQRLEQRRLAGQRHPGHDDTSAAVIADRTADDFLDLPGCRLIYAGGDPAALLQALDARVPRRG